ncbi:uncharacterized protein LOC144466536 [Epinephelus lanceolatus]
MAKILQRKLLLQHCCQLQSNPKMEGGLIKDSLKEILTRHRPPHQEKSSTFIERRPVSGHHNPNPQTQTSALEDLTAVTCHQINKLSAVAAVKQQCRPVPRSQQLTC